MLHLQRGLEQDQALFRLLGVDADFVLAALFLGELDEVGVPFRAEQRELEPAAALERAMAFAGAAPDPGEQRNDMPAIAGVFGLLKVGKPLAGRLQLLLGNQGSPASRRYAEQGNERQRKSETSPPG